MGGAFSSVCLNVSKSMGNVGLFKSFALLSVCADVRTSTTRERSEQHQEEKLSQHFGTTTVSKTNKKERVTLSLEEIKRLLFNQSSVERDVHNGSLDCWQTQ